MPDSEVKELQFVADSNVKDLKAIIANSEVKEMKFPSAVVFKGDNSQYLKVWTYDANKWDRTAFLQFSGAKYENESKFEVINQADGYVAIRSLHNQKYWNGHPGSWIRANATSVDEHALFKPVLLADKKVVFIYKPTGLYCKRLNCDGWESLLNAQIAHIDDCCKLTVEEPVIRRTITHVEYELEKKNILSVEPMVLDEQVVTNNTDNIANFAINYSHSYTKSHSFTRSVSIMEKVETTIEASIPFIAKGEIKLSASITGTLAWGTTTTESSTVSGTITVKDIIPGKKVKVTVSGEKAIINVPYKYQQIDYLSDGTVKTTDLFDGVFYGVNEYFSRYEAVNL